MKITTETTNEEIARRYPTLTAHVVCESLGYFTPACAARAIRDAVTGKPFFCEWYMHRVRYAPTKEEDYLKAITETTREVLQEAIARRKFHTGMMSSLAAGKAAVARFVTSPEIEPVPFMSW